MKDTMDPLLGQAPDKELVNHIEEVVMAHPIVHGIHDLIVHDYGPGRLMISLHAEVSASGNLLEIHDEIDNIEHELQQKLNCAATIHMDPIVTDNEEVNRLHDRVLELAKSLDSSLNIHDFRMVEGPTHTNLIFDVAVPYECKMTDVEVSNTLKKGVRELFGGQYFAVIQVDRVYC